MRTGKWNVLGNVSVFGDRVPHGGVQPFYQNSTSNFGAKCGAHLVTYHPGIKGGQNSCSPPYGGSELGCFLIYQANCSNAKPMAPTYAESSDLGLMGEDLPPLGRTGPRNRRGWFLADRRA
jgi:hypothetical protein